MQVSRTRRSVAPCFALVLGALLCSTRSALGAPKDAQATRLADQAINEDYLAARPKPAAAKLRKALKLCGEEQCSSAVLARIYRDLGVVSIAGLKQGTAGREAFARAVQADPEIRLEKDLTTPEIREAFSEVGGQLGPASKTTERAPGKPAAPEKPQPEAGKRKPAKQPAPRNEADEDEEVAEADEEESEEDEEESEDEVGADGAVKVVLEEDASTELDHEGKDDEEEDAASSDSTSGVARKNYASLTLQQDFLMHGAEKTACNSGVYSCFDASGEEYLGPMYAGGGNAVSGGLGIATTRILLGYDRLLLDNLLAGARIGFAFGGGPTPSTTQDKFLPVHLELRAQYHLFEQPFTRKGFRPYGALGLGIAEVDSKVSVRYYESEQAYQMSQSRSLEAWRKTGKSFIAPSVGSSYAFAAVSSVSVELRAMIMLGATAFAPAIAVGYSHGL